MQLGPFWVGDSPVSPLVIDLLEDDTDDLDGYTAAEVKLVAPTGTSKTIAAILSDTDVSFTLPLEPFPLPGLYQLRIVLTSPSGRLSLDPVWVVAQEDDGWATLALARDPDAGGWAEASQIGDVKLWRLLQISRHQVLEFAPSLTETDAVPLHYVEGQLMQARNLYNAGRVSPGGDVGGGDFAITPHPLDWQIKQILRPRRGVPVIG